MLPRIPINICFTRHPSWNRPGFAMLLVTEDQLASDLFLYNANEPDDDDDDDDDDGKKYSSEYFNYISRTNIGCGVVVRGLVPSGLMEMRLWIRVVVDTSSEVGANCVLTQASTSSAVTFSLVSDWSWSQQVASLRAVLCSVLDLLLWVSSISSTCSLLPCASVVVFHRALTVRKELIVVSWAELFIGGFTATRGFWQAKHSVAALFIMEPILENRNWKWSTTTTEILTSGSGNEDLATDLPGQPQVNFQHYASYVKVNESHGRALFLLVL
ncbi:hypothetical protein FNV43_RR14718 [Rhamnella rubrinervis]|uniref:Uncharacterized protein n=1 Tax=Rhamnella rubrinervis TaxID=2594499 RepID=A0A8K0MGM4_9ROSA|nr:hypothetical protein FNV43_RR14718 [Rhamnella rubrinervis]